MMSNENANNDAAHSTGQSGTVRLDTPSEGGTVRVAQTRSSGGTVRVAEPQGSGGTVRVPETQGAGGTVRVAETQGSDGTVRVVKQGPGGTVHVDMQGSDGTVRVAAATPLGTQGTVHVDTPQAVPAEGVILEDRITSDRLQSGQPVVVNGHTYRIQAPLTTNSGEARTYTATDGNGRTVVVKHYRRGFKAPMAVLHKLQQTPHDNIVGIIDIGTLEGHDVEVLEFLAGGTLDQYLRRNGPIHDLAALRRLTASIADGLDHLHRTVGLIYQDLKPENILLADNSIGRAVLADFGISSLRAGGSDEVRVTAQGTREYAAPELSRFGNQTEAFVTDKVDYFALGITLLECWQGTRPFLGLPDGRRLNQIHNKEVAFPPDIDSTLEILIKGLISPAVKERFGREQVRLWISGQSLTVDYASIQKAYHRRIFTGEEYFESPTQLAALLEKYPEKGCDYLYLGSIQKWLDLSNDMEMSTEMQKIVRLFDRDDQSRKAGLVRAIYALDSSRPFASAGGRSASTVQELGDILLTEQAHYSNSLKQANDPFYMYLQAHGESEFASHALAQFTAAKDQSALSWLVFELQSEGRAQIKLQEHFYFLPEELAEASDAVKQEVVTQLQQNGSRVLLWLVRLGIVDDQMAFADAKVCDQFSIIQAMPWLPVRTMLPDWQARQGSYAIELCRNSREDLLGVFADCGFDFNVAFGKATPLVQAAAWARDSCIATMLDRGAQIDLVAPCNASALDTAASFGRESTVALLLARGASLSPSGDSQLGALNGACAKNSLTGEARPINGAIITALLKAGATPNRRAPDGSLPLHQLICSTASPGEVFTLIELLIEAGADVNLGGKNLVVNSQSDCNAWFTAINRIHFCSDSREDAERLLARLIRAGADINAVYEGKAALHWAAAWGDANLVSALLALKASPDQVADNDMLPGTYARLAGASALDSALKPGSMLGKRALLMNVSIRLLQGLALAALALMLFFLGAFWTVQSFNFSPGSVLGYLIFAALAARLTAAGSFSAFGRSVQATLKSNRGWLKFVLGGPILASSFAILGALVPNKSALNIAPQVAPLPLAILWGLLTSLLLIQIRVGLPRHRAWLKYQQPRADHNSDSLAPNRRLLCLIALPLAFFGSGAIPQWSRVHYGLAKTMPHSSEATTSINAKPLKHGKLNSPFVVRFANGSTCTLQTGTELEERFRPSSNDENIFATLPKPSGSCRNRIPPSQWVLLPTKKIDEIDDDSSGQAPVSGPVSALSTDGWPVISGRTLPLSGIAAIVPNQRQHFEQWLKVHGNRLDCSDKHGTWKCLTEDRLDVAEALLRNGAATAADNAPRSYQKAMSRARSEKRGQWK